jgi:hypothetical protein
MCLGCEIEAPEYAKEDAGVAAWNRRAPSAEETRLRAEVASLRATLGQRPAIEGLVQAVEELDARVKRLEADRAS